MLILFDEQMQDHEPGAGHPEAPARLAAAAKALEDKSGLTWRKPSPVPRERLLAIHTAEHVDNVDSHRGQRAALDGDTVVSPGSVPAAYLAAGAVCEAVDAVCDPDGDHQHAFALVRPPGHHAESHTAMGFCLFNNIAVGAEHARRAHGVERVMILDWDVHHGNGTQHTFYSRDDVLFMSLHQFPFYPGTGDHDELGSDAGVGFTINVPFPGGCDDGDYRAAFDQVLTPIADHFAPDLVMVSAGFDAHRLDPLAGMRATEEGYADMAARVRDIADRHAKGRLVLALEGGYDLNALGRSVRATVDVLTGTPAPSGASKADKGGNSLDRITGVVRDRWKL